MSAIVDSLIEKARAAQALVASWPQDRVDAMVAAVGWALYKEANARACAELAVEETGMGVFEDKLLKHRKKTLGTLRDLQGIKTVGVVEADEARGLVKVAKPVGVVAAVAPVTNPTSTPASNGLAILKTRNAVVFAAHLFARRTTAFAAELMRGALAQVGAPVDLVQVLPKPTKEAIRELMSAADLVVATGSSALVTAAYSSGTPAYGVGAGNACVVIDETADIAEAAAKVAAGKTFDNATSCSSENSLVIHASVGDGMLKALAREGGYVCSDSEKQKLAGVMWPDGTALSSSVVGQPAAALAAMAGLTVPDGTRLLVVRGGDIEHDAFAREKLSPVLAVWTYSAFEEALAQVERITRQCGYGHSCGIHSSNHEHVMQLAESCHVARVMVDQTQCFANSGNYDNGMPFSMTLGCGTWGGNITTENITWKHFLNITWVSRPIAEAAPDENELFGDHWKANGK